MLPNTGSPPLEKARAVQREAYDWALKTLDQSPQLKVRAKGDSLWARLTLARKDGTLPREPLVLQRAAAAQAHAVFSRLEEHWRQQTDKALREQDKKVSARLVRQLGRGPKPITSYLRGHPSRQHRRQAIAILEGVSVCEGTGGRTVKVRGVGTITLEDPVHEPVRSAQLVLRKGKLWLHAQHGEELPEPKALNDNAIGYDSGIIHTLSSSQGEHLHRADTSVLQQRARNLYRHRRKCCTYKSRQWRRIGKETQKILNEVSGIQQNWERHTARDISEKNSLVGLENLELQSMSASAKGTSSMPGSSRKRGLNEKLARARIGRLHHTITRRCVRDGTWLVMVNAVNTSIQCSRCGEKDKESRNAEQFRCTKCGFEIHADENAGRNIRTRAQNVMNGYVRTRGGRDGCPGSHAPDRQGLHEGRGEAAARLLDPREAGVARQVSGLGVRPGCIGSLAVKPSI